MKIKIYKIILLLFSIALSQQLDAKKIYYTGFAMPNILDICIYLQKEEYDHLKDKGIKSSEELEAEKGKLGAITQGLHATFAKNEAMIVSAPLIRAMITYLKKTNIKALTFTLAKENWLIYKTQDRKFAVLIPSKKYKYAITAGKLGLEKLGLNANELQLISPKNGDEFYNIFNPGKKYYGDIDIRTLKNIFSKTTKAQGINKRIYLSGHGTKEEERVRKIKEIEEEGEEEEVFKKTKTITEPGIIAQLRMSDYINFLKYLKKINCSFLAISSCYAGGWNTTLALKTVLEQKKDIEKVDLPYIFVVKGVPDNPVFSRYIKIETFFQKLNDFFMSEQYLVKKLIFSHFNIPLFPKEKSIEKIKKQNVEEIVNKMSEQELLTGTKLVIPQVGKIRLGNIIQRDPKVFTRFNPILKNLVGVIPENRPYIKFPGMKNLIPATKILKQYGIHELVINSTFLQKHKAPSIKIKEKTMEIKIDTFTIQKPIQINAFDFFPDISLIIPGEACTYIKEMTVNLARQKNFIPIILSKFQQMETSFKKIFFIKKLIINKTSQEGKAFSFDLQDKPIILENVLIIKYPTEGFTTYFKFKDDYYKGTLSAEAKVWKDLRFEKLPYSERSILLGFYKNNIEGLKSKKEIIEERSKKYKQLIKLINDLIEQSKFKKEVKPSKQEVKPYPSEPKPPKKEPLKTKKEKPGKRIGYGKK